MQQTRDGLQRTAMVLASAVAQDPTAANAWQETLVELERDTGLRFTILEPSGRVIADSASDPTHMEDHRSRPEITAAIEHGVGEAVRRSSTTAVEMLYVAVPLRRNGRVVAVVRVASSLKVLREEIHGNRRFLWLTALLVGLVAAPISYLVVGRIVKPLSQFTEVISAIARGNYRQPVAIGGRDELGRLGDAFRRMQEELANRIEQLQQYAERLAAVLSGMVDGVLAVDAEQRIILANDAAKSLLGIRSNEIVGRALLEATRNLEIHEAVREALGKGGPCEREVTTTDASRHTLRVLATRLRGEPCSGVLIVLHDVTQLRRLENMRRDFVANVSHELKTPLSSIKAYAETLRLGAIDDPEHNLRFVQRIEEQAQRLHQLIADLLHLARVESGKQAFQFAFVPLLEAVERCVGNFREIASTNGVDLHIEPGCEAVVVWVDRQGLATILDNLLDNAIKYTLRGGKVRVRWRRENQTAVLEVQDTGIGIAVEDQKRIFERFYRVDKARSRELGGTGLGLAIVKHLVQAFGGEVRVVSELGAGSTFAVRLRTAANT